MTIAVLVSKMSIWFHLNGSTHGLSFPSFSGRFFFPLFSSATKTTLSSSWALFNESWIFFFQECATVFFLFRFWDRVCHLKTLRLPQDSWWFFTLSVADECQSNICNSSCIALVQFCFGLVFYFSPYFLSFSIGHFVMIRHIFFFNSQFNYRATLERAIAWFVFERYVKQ